MTYHQTDKEAEALIEQRERPEKEPSWLAKFKRLPVEKKRQFKAWLNNFLGKLYDSRRN